MYNVTHAHFNAICALKVTPEQTQFIDTNVYSIALAYCNPHVTCFGLFLNDIPIGFTMLNLDPLKEIYCIDRLMIDCHYQNMGYGRQAINEIVNYVKSRYVADAIEVCVVDVENSPINFYLKMGFEDTHEFNDDERILKFYFAH